MELKEFIVNVPSDISEGILESQLYFNELRYKIESLSQHVLKSCRHGTQDNRFLY